MQIYLAIVNCDYITKCYKVSELQCAMNNVEKKEIKSIP